MRLVYHKTKLAVDSLISFLVWSSVLAVGAMISYAVFQLLRACGLGIYHLVPL